jgi:hypothetical protein
MPFNMEFDNTLEVSLPPAVALRPNKPISAFTLVLKTLWSAIVQLFRRNPSQS